MSSDMQAAQVLQSSVYNKVTLSDEALQRMTIENIVNGVFSGK